MGHQVLVVFILEKKIEIEPFFHGGNHEFGFRAGTPNLAGIIGFTCACQIYQKEREKEAQRIKKLRDKLIKGVLITIPGTRLNGHPTKRLVHNVNFSFQGIEGEAIITQLDLLGVATSTGSACVSPSLTPSHILLALGLKPEVAQGSLRITLGRWTKESEIDYFLKILPKAIKKLRKISPFKI